MAKIALEEETYTTDTEADIEDIMEKVWGMKKERRQKRVTVICDLEKLLNYVCIYPQDL